MFRVAKSNQNNCIFIACRLQKPKVLAHPKNAQLMSGKLPDTSGMQYSRERF
jgi:hypothetical protein